MYYRLNKDYALRGWEKSSVTLVRRNDPFVKALNQQESGVLLLCDGTGDFDTYPLMEEEQQILRKYIEQGVLEEATQPCPLDPWQQYRYYPNRYVSSIFWSMTGRCNYHCRHCFMDAPSGAMGEISHEEALSLIDQMAECGIRRIDLTGGEPFVRKDFWQLIDYMRSHDIMVDTIYTNGALLTEQTLDAFEERGMKPEFSVSFDGVGWHDWLRGVRGAEKIALDAMERAIKRGFQVDVETCIHRGNVTTLRETIKRLAEIGVPYVKCASISDTPLWLQNCAGNQLSYSEYLEAMLDYIPQYYEDAPPITVLLCDVATLRMDEGVASFEVIPEKFSGKQSCLDCLLCGAMRSSCYIAPDGRMLPCMPMTACQEKLEFDRFQDIGLRAGLSNSFYLSFVDKRIKDLAAENEKCRNCEHLLVCGGGCRAAALEKVGSLMGPDPNQCFLWENGYVERIRAAAEQGVANYKQRKEAAKNAD